jgi:hypothetical protein
MSLLAEVSEFNEILRKVDKHLVSIEHRISALAQAVGSTTMATKDQLEELLAEVRESRGAEESVLTLVTNLRDMLVAANSEDPVVQEAIDLLNQGQSEIAAAVAENPEPGPAPAPTAET